MEQPPLQPPLLGPLQRAEPARDYAGIMRVVLGLLLAPALPIAITARDSRSWVWTYALALVSGVPLVFVYELLGLRRLWHYLAGSFLLPFVGGMGMLATVSYEPGWRWPPMIERAATFSGWCAVGALAFWSIAIRGRQTSKVAVSGP